MENFKLNENFHELSQQEAESIDGGLHFVVGFVQEAKNVTGIALGFVKAIADVLDKFTGGLFQIPSNPLK